MNLPAIASWLPTSRWVRYLLAGFAVVALLAGAGYYLTHHYDPVRVVYKRFKAPEKYLYEEPSPLFLKTDPAALITIATAEDAARVRAAAIDVIWGGQGLPTERMPESVEEGITDETFADLANLARIDRLRIVMDNGVYSIAYHFRPRRGNGRLVLYHHGYAGDIRDAKRVIGALVGEGYAVIGINYLGYGGNWAGGLFYLKRFGWYQMSVHLLLDLADRPMMYFIEPVVVAVNYARRRLGHEVVDMVGFSAGGWTAMVAAAVEPRIRRSYPVAGGYPLYLRSGYEANQSAPPQYYMPLLRAANYLEMFVLGASGAGRRQLQVFNRFDRCCFRNTLARLYAPAVSEVVSRLGGGFRVVIDETHADHKISDFALAAILEDLAAP